jgi:predicted ATPase/Tfp pilus assembly protein PilF
LVFPAAAAFQTSGARASLPDGAGLRELGLHRLRDLQQPERLHQLLHPDLPAELPPPRTLERFRHNLPQQWTSFIGRERELAEITRLLGEQRLVTLTGAGGCGKTRLALQVAADRVDAYPDGAWLVELAALADLGLVPQAVATALGLREEPGRPLTATLLDYLRTRELLLLLDNCEHLVDACAGLVETLLRDCPGLRVLATSRELLNIQGEMTWRVPSLSLPDESAVPGPAGAAGSRTWGEAVELFVQRAAAGEPRFALTERNAPAVAQICRRLDGIPLAIELAAARVKLLTPEQIAARLQDRFRLLTGGSRTTLPRQQTLRGLIDWSYELLSEPERALLRRLSVFAGGFTLEAAERVCADGAEPGAAKGSSHIPDRPCAIRPEDVLGLLGSLVDKSLAMTEEGEAERRYRLLETIRQYSAEKLRETGEGDEPRRRHRDWFLALAEQAASALTGPEQGQWLERLEREHDNLRAALEECLAGGEAELGLRLGAALCRFWMMRGHLSEGRQDLSKLLAAGGARTLTVARAGAANGAGNLACSQGDYATARTLYEESLAIRREVGDQRGIAGSLGNMGIVAREQGDYATARALHEESLMIMRDFGDPHGIARSLNNLGLVSREQGNYVAARALHEESLAICREIGDRDGIAASLGNMGLVAQLQGDHMSARALLEESLGIARELGNHQGIANSLNDLGNIAKDLGNFEVARARYEESLTIAREIGDQHGIARSLNNLGNVALEQRDYRAARARYEESLTICREISDQRHIAASLDNLGLVSRAQGDYGTARTLHKEGLAICREIGDKRGIIVSLEGIAALAAAPEQWQQAARLFGAAAALRVTIGAPLPPSERAEQEHQVAAARRALGEAAFAVAWGEGQALTLEEAAAFALEEEAPP